MMKLKNHVVICNWNEKSYELVEKLHSHLLEETQSDWHTIAVVAPNVANFPDHESFRDTVLIPGDPGNANMLERANANKARTIIILPDLKKKNPDDEVLKIALTVNIFLKDHAKDRLRGDPPPRVVAKIVDHDNAAGFRGGDMTGINEVICEGDLGIRVLAQTCITPGMTYLMRDLLDYSELNSELYLTDVPQDWVDAKLVLTSFKSITSAVMSHPDSFTGVIPVGYYRPRPNGDHEILVNPREDQFAASGINQVEKSDKIMVLAIDSKTASGFLHGGPPNQETELNPS